LCRAYEHREIPEDVLDRILDLAARFPSVGNTQPQEFIVIRNQTKIRLARAALDQFYLAEAPVVIVVVSDMRRSRPRYVERGEHFYSIINGAFAAMLILLAAVVKDWGRRLSARSTMTRCARYSVYREPCVP